MYPDFVFVQFSISLRESPLSVQNAILPCILSGHIPATSIVSGGANLTGQSGSTVCKLESWRFNDKGLRPGHTYWLRALMIPPRSAVSLLLLCAFTLQNALLDRIALCMPSACHRYRGLYVWSQFTRLWPSTGEECIYIPAAALSVPEAYQGRVVPVYQAFQTQGIYILEKSCGSSSFSPRGKCQQPLPAGKGGERNAQLSLHQGEPPYKMSSPCSLPCRNPIKPIGQ